MPDTAANPLKAYNVPFDSMEPAIESGSDVIGDRFYYTTHQLKRWDVVVFSKPGATGAAEGRFVKRIIGLAGETIQLSHKGLSINGAIVPIPPALNDRFSSFKNHQDHRYGNQPYTIANDSVFVIGDNAQVYQSDSREFGAIPIRTIEARVVASVRIVPVT